MTRQSGPVYEVTFFMDTEIAGDFERWLEQWARDAARIPGVDDCVCYANADDENGRARRVCVTMFAGDDPLNAFLDSADDDIEASVPPEFAGRVEVTARVLREDSRVTDPAIMPDCLNCGARLHGQYCAVCGQRARSRLISLWELVTDAFGDLFEIDSRLWKTLTPLLVRPGRLTLDYLQGRRARYMPPFRMYLVFSVLFFLVAFFDPHRELSLFMEQQPEASTGLDIAVNGDTPAVQCDFSDLDTQGWPHWIQRRLTRERLTEMCERAQVGGGRAFLDKLLDEVPTALIVLLPLMAFVLKLLYPLAKRYYVEHLLFFVHFHSFFFLLLTLQILFARMAMLVSIPDPIRVLAIVATSFYVPVYLFVAMRRVYGQGRIITSIKYIALVVAYSLGFSATMLGALTVAAFSV
ncbi:MAG: DUF3667 domain-containing protein [Woeseiaceae bacterium]